MPRGVKRQRETDCGGNGCGQRDCRTCKDDPIIMNFTPGGDRSNLFYTQPSLLLTALRQAESRATGPTAARDHDRVPASRPPPAASHSAPEFRTPVPKPVTASATPDHTLTQMVNALDQRVLRDMVIKLAPGDSLLADAIKVAYRTQPAHMPSQQPPLSGGRTPRTMRPAIPLSQMQPVIDFDRYSKSAWHALNSSEILSLGGSRQYDASGDVYRRIGECIEAIDEKTKEDSPLGTKQSAVETLRKIAKTIILGEDTIGHEVRKELQFDSDIADVIVRILESMTPEERIRTGEKADSKGTLISKVEWVRNKAEGYCLEGLYGLDSALEMMKTGWSSLASSAEGSSSAPIDLTS